MATIGQVEHDVNDIEKLGQEYFHGAAPTFVQLAFMIRISQGCPTLVAQGCPTLVAQGCPTLVAQGCPTLVALFATGWA